MAKIPDGHDNNLFVTVGFSFDWGDLYISSGYNYNCFILPSMKNKVFMLSLRNCVASRPGYSPGQVQKILLMMPDFWVDRKLGGTL